MTNSEARVGAVYGDAFDPSFDDDGRLAGYSFTGTRGRGVYEWQEKRDAAEFKKLCDRLRQKKWWRELSAEERQAVYLKRRAWAKANPERAKEITRKAKAKRRKSGKAAAESRARRARKRAKRRAATVYTCAMCPAQWSPIGRIPSRPPKYCGQRCRSRAQYQREAAREPVSGVERVGYGDRVRSVLALGGDLTPVSVAEALGLPKRYAQRVLVEMCSRGHLDRVGRGHYKVRVCEPEPAE